MQATLYAVKLAGDWCWRTTLAYGLDQVYWREKYGIQVQMVRLKDHISWGQAARLCRLLTLYAAVPRRSGAQPDTRNDLTNEWRELIIAADTGSLTVKTVTNWLDNPNAWVEDTIEGISKQLFLDTQTVLHHAEVRHIAELLRGRFLFGDELLSLCAARQIQLAVNWVYLVQAASLWGLVEISCGVEAVPTDNGRNGRKGRTGASGRSGTMAHWQCNRCGSGPEAMRLAHCLSCGGPCPYCQNCLGMGRSRSCTPLLASYGEGGGNALVAVGGNRGMAEFADGKRKGMVASGATGFSALDSSTGRRLEVGREHRDGLEGEEEPPPHSRYAPLFERFGLSPAQCEATGQALAFLEQTDSSGWVEGEGQPQLSDLPSTDYGTLEKHPPGMEFLIWAVTGAGKTEMIYPLIAHEVAMGRKVLVATPRRDVVLELLPRMQRAFPERTLIALYGGSEQRWDNAEITLATTHQLLRFRHRFDLAVIDELDAFPFHNNPMLQYAARMAVRSGGRTIYLSATPPTAMQRQVKAGRLPCARVPVRFHRHPLPIPWLLRIPPLAKWVKAGRLPRKLKHMLDRSLARGAQLFLFVPQIRRVLPLVELLRRAYPGEAIEGTSSQDEERAEKVQGLRAKAIRILVTTTILERGVTIPKSDVFVLDAGAGLFDEAALVQMAGRAGRSLDDPAGYVVFAAAELTRSQVGAVRQIRRMNRLALRKRFLLEKKAGKLLSLWRRGDR